MRGAAGLHGAQIVLQDRGDVLCAVLSDPLRENGLVYHVKI